MTTRDRIKTLTAERDEARRRASVISSAAVRDIERFRAEVVDSVSSVADKAFVAGFEAGLDAQTRFKLSMLRAANELQVFASIDAAVRKCKETTWQS